MSMPIPTGLHLIMMQANKISAKSIVFACDTW